MISSLGCVSMRGWPRVFLAREDDSESHIDCIGPISKIATLWIYKAAAFSRHGNLVGSRRQTLQRLPAGPPQDSPRFWNEEDDPWLAWFRIATDRQSCTLP